MVTKEKAMKTNMEAPKKESKLGLCMRSIICCKRTNKVKQKTVTMEKKGIARICPCLGGKSTDEKLTTSKAWSNKSDGTADSKMSKKGYDNESFGLVTYHCHITFLSFSNLCSRLCMSLMCCRKKPKPEDRRSSMMSKKASIGPTVQTEVIKLLVSDP